MKRSVCKFFYKIPIGLLSTIVVLAILWLTLARAPLGDVSMPHIPGLDKVVHACMFGGLMFALEFDGFKWRAKRRCLIGEAALVGWGTAAKMALAVIVFGGVVELLQDAMKMGRGGDWFDWIADAVGVVVALAVSPVVVSWLFGLRRSK